MPECLIVGAGQANAMKSRIMYVENKSGGITGPGRISRVTFSKTGKSVYYRGRRLRRILGGGFKSNYYDVKTREEYWISGCKRSGGDRLYAGTIEIDEDVREEYWTRIRSKPDCKDQASIRDVGKYGLA